MKIYARVSTSYNFWFRWFVWLPKINFFIPANYIFFYAVLQQVPRWILPAVSWKTFLSSTDQTCILTKEPGIRVWSVVYAAGQLGSSFCAFDVTRLRFLRKCNVRPSESANQTFSGLCWREEAGVVLATAQLEACIIPGWKYWVYFISCSSSGTERW